MKPPPSITHTDPTTGIPTPLSQYPWMIVSDAQGTMLFILARDTAAFKQQYEHAVLKRVKELGFIAENVEPLSIRQSSRCLYPPPPIVM
eukprot:gene26300-32863_t